MPVSLAAEAEGDAVAAVVGAAEAEGDMAAGAAVTAALGEEALGALAEVAEASAVRQAGEAGAAEAEAAGVIKNVKYPIILPPFDIAKE